MQTSNRFSSIFARLKTSNLCRTATVSTGNSALGESQDSSDGIAQSLNAKYLCNTIPKTDEIETQTVEDGEISEPEEGEIESFQALGLRKRILDEVEGDGNIPASTAQNTIELSEKVESISKPDTIQLSNSNHKKKRRKQNKQRDPSSGVQESAKIYQAATGLSLQGSKPSLTPSLQNKPHKKYICKACSLQGVHYYHECDNPNGAPVDPNYVCHRCNISGHDVKWCPKKLKTKHSNGSKKKATPNKPKIPNEVVSPVLQLPVGDSTTFPTGVSISSTDLTALHARQVVSADQSPSGILNLFSLASNAGFYSDNEEDNTIPTFPTENSVLYNPVSWHSTLYSSQESKDIPKQILPTTSVTTTVSPSVSTNLLPSTTQCLPAQPPPPPLCRYYLSGKCLKRSHCSFSHTQSTEPCAFFHLYGGCAKSNECAFSHMAIDQERREQLVKSHAEFKERKRMEKVLWGVRNALVKGGVEVLEQVGLGCEGEAKEVVNRIYDAAKISGVEGVDEALYKQFGMDFGGAGGGGMRKLKDAEKRRAGALSDPSLTEAVGGEIGGKAVPGWIQELTMGMWKV